MSDILAQFGVSAGQLAEAAQAPSYPKPVPGRVVHIDADFLAYQVSAERKEELDPEDPTPRRSLEDMKHNAKRATKHIVKLAGATDYVLHTTPSGCNKGGRDEQAVQQEYQASRKARSEKPEHMETIRAWLTTELRGQAHMDQEADDGMATAAWNAEDPNLVVIASKDKDLLMCPGLHLDIDTGRILKAKDEFGYIEVDDSKSSKKVIGLGTKFFWAQCLMGDTADNIKGVPVVPGWVVQEYQPTAAYKKLMERWVKLPPRADMTEAAKEAADRLEKNIDIANKKMSTCGPVLTYSLLEDCRTDLECFRRVKLIWQAAEENGHEFTHWKTGVKVSATQALLGDMRTLWMRRNKNPDDVMAWLKEKVDG